MQLKTLLRVASLCVPLCLAGARPLGAQSPCPGYVSLTLSPNSPPVPYLLVVSDGNCNSLILNCPKVTNVTITSVTSEVPWLTVVGITQPSLPISTPYGETLGGGFANLLIDPSGLAPGCYFGNIEQSYKYFELNSYNTYTPDGSTPQFVLAVSATSGVMLLDPVPDLLNGPNVMTSSQLQSLLTKGRTVKGAAADGVTQIVVRVDTNTPNEQLTLTLLDDFGATSTSTTAEGALDVPGGTNFTQSQLTVSTGSLDANGLAHAFAAYRAPIDFARPNGSGGYQIGSCAAAEGASNLPDNQSPCRTVQIQVADTATSHTLFTTPVAIVRPPVILVHGLWSDSSSWDNFAPVYFGPAVSNALFLVKAADYSSKLNLVSSSPFYPSLPFPPRENSLGYEHNAPKVLRKITDTLVDFKTGNNPLNIPLAAVQVDLIGHSLGGIMARTLPLLPQYLNNRNYSQGPVHKLITLDTPHLGSPLSAMLVNILQNGCTRNWMAYYGMYSFNNVNYVGGGTDNGAVGELVGNGVAVDASLSPALTAIAQPGVHSIPTALVGGYYTDWTSLDCTGSCTPARIKTACPVDALASTFSHSGWPANFPTTSYCNDGSTNNCNDGIVGTTSQLNGAASSNLLFKGLAHTPGIVGNLLGLAFTAPSALDAAPTNPIANEVLTLLNTPVNQAPFAPINP